MNDQIAMQYASAFDKLMQSPVGFLEVSKFNPQNMSGILRVPLTSFRSMDQQLYLNINGQWIPTPVVSFSKRGIQEFVLYILPYTQYATYTPYISQYGKY